MNICYYKKKEFEVSALARGRCVSCKVYSIFHWASTPRRLYRAAFIKISVDNTTS